MRSSTSSVARRWTLRRAQWTLMMGIVLGWSSCRVCAAVNAPGYSADRPRTPAWCTDRARGLARDRVDQDDRAVRIRNWRCTWRCRSEQEVCSLIAQLTGPMAHIAYGNDCIVRHPQTRPNDPATFSIRTQFPGTHLRAPQVSRPSRHHGAGVERAQAVPAQYPSAPAASTANVPNVRFMITCHPFTRKVATHRVPRSNLAARPVAGNGAIRVCDVRGSSGRPL